MGKREELEARYPGWVVDVAGQFHMQPEQYDEQHRNIAVPFINLGGTPEPDDLFRAVFLSKKKVNIVVRLDTLEPADHRAVDALAEDRKVYRTWYECSDCNYEAGSTKDLDTDNPIYECGNCGERYSKEDSHDGLSNRCPDCAKWGHKVAEGSCPECGHGEMALHKTEVQ